jgi:hypothetical protein
VLSVFRINFIYFFQFSIVNVGCITLHRFNICVIKDKTHHTSITTHNLPYIKHHPQHIKYHHTKKIWYNFKESATLHEYCRDMLRILMPCKYITIYKYFAHILVLPSTWNVKKYMAYILTVPPTLMRKQWAVGGQLGQRALALVVWLGRAHSPSRSQGWVFMCLHCFYMSELFHILHIL